MGAAAITGNAVPALTYHAGTKPGSILRRPAPTCARFETCLESGECPSERDDQHSDTPVSIWVFSCGNAQRRKLCVPAGITSHSPTLNASRLSCALVPALFHSVAVL